MTPQEVAVLLHEHGSGRGNVDAEGPPDSLHVDRRQQRTDLLAAVLSSCRDLWSTESEELDLMAEKLADGSRHVAWRLPYGESGILEFFVALLADGRRLRQTLHIHALRLIGNSCADTNENRARLVDQDRLLSITKHVADESLIPFNIPVLYNILVDYGTAEPAQSLASKSHLSKQLVRLLSLPHISQYAPFVPYVCKILALLVAQEGEAAAADPATVRVLLTLANQPAAREDVEDFIGLAAVAVAYLASETLQSRFIADRQMPLLMDAFHHAHVRLDMDAVDDEDVVAQVKQLRASLLSTLADVSGKDSFSLTYPLAHDVPQTLLDWIRGDNVFLQSAACLALGNISRSDAASIALVEEYRAHDPLVKLLSDPDVTDSQLLHAACSFLKNLAIPPSNKPQLRDLLRPQCVPRLYALDALPQVQFAAVSLTRLLLLNCPANTRQICTRSGQFSSIPDGPDVEEQQTSASGIIALHGRSDAEPTRLAAARCVAAICRALYTAPVSDILTEAPSVIGTTDSPPPHSDDESCRRAAFYKAHAVQKPLAFLITQDKWPSLRSEAWFVLALMARSKDGAGLVLSLLDADAAVEARLRETITGAQNVRPGQSQEDDDDAAAPPPPPPPPPPPRQGEEHASSAAGSAAQITSAALDLHLEPQQVDAEQKASMARMDAENALILCTELVKLGEGALTAERLAGLRALVREGTRRVVRDRSEEAQGQGEN
ncbi:hypothetical protein E4U41_002249 [Claviceps citrina]|nr:hypothetical protein E4U41_002249 [Claviceps citrina]